MAIEREQFAAYRKRRFKKVTIGDGHEIRIQSLTAGELHGIGAAPAEEQNGRMIAAAIVNDDGKRLFADAEHEIFSEMDAAFVVPLVSAINEHLGLVETNGKNSPETIAGGSP